MRIDAETVIAAVHSSWGSACTHCGVVITGYEVVLSWVSGFKTSIGCVECLASRTARDRREFLEHAIQNIRRLDCFRAGWIASSRRLRDANAWPHERFPAEVAERIDDEDDDLESDFPADSRATTLAAAEDWDAGEMSCGDLVLELRLRLAALAPGQVIHVRATDPGAPGDLPAWCRLTQNPMLNAEHPDYWIQRRP